MGRGGKLNYCFRNTDNSTGEERENGECRCCITEYGTALPLHLTVSSRILWQKKIYGSDSPAKVVSEKETCMVKIECI